MQGSLDSKLIDEPLVLIGVNIRLPDAFRDSKFTLKVLSAKVKELCTTGRIFRHYKDRSIVA